MGQQGKSRKVRLGGRPPHGGDPAVTRDGISTESHLDIYRRLVKAGPAMHGTPGPRKPRKS